MADTKDGSSTYPTRSTVRHLPSFGKTSKKTHTITFLTQLRQAKTGSTPAATVAKGRGFILHIRAIACSPTHTQRPVSSGVQTLAGNLTLRLILGRRPTDSIQRHQLLCAKGLVGAGHPFARILPDTGVSHSFVSQSWITKPIPQ